MCWRLQPFVREAATICADCNHLPMLPGYLVTALQVLLRADPVPIVPMPGMFLGASP